MNVLFSFKQLRTLLAMLAMMIFSFPDAVADAPSFDNQGPGRRALSGTDKHEPTIFASPR